MWKIAPYAAIALVLLGVTAPAALAAVLSNNLNQTLADTVNATPTNWLGASFGTEPSASSLSSVSVYIGMTSPGAAIVDIYTNSGSQPGTLVDTLTSPASYSTSLTETTFTTSGIDLMASSTYWMVLHAASGSFEVAYTNSNVGQGDGFQHTWGESADAGAGWNTYDYDPLMIQVNTYDTYSKYDFSFNYADGDYYTGSIYAPTGCLAANGAYGVGYTQNVTVENGQTGAYAITGATQVSDGSQNGQVWVNTYHDVQSGQDFPVFGGGLSPQGSSYLGSESGYLIDNSSPTHFFGNDHGTFYEADRGGVYDFTYVYGPVPGHCVINEVTDNGKANWEPCINDAGWMVYESYWEGNDGAGNSVHHADIYLEHNGIATQLPSPALENYGPDINNSGQVVWQAYDEAGTQHIYLYDQGIICAISDPAINSYNPRINDAGQVVWEGQSNGGPPEIYLYSDGGVKQLTQDNWDSCPVINNRGEVAWIGNTGNYDEVFLYKDGATTQLTNDVGWKSSVDINDAGWLAWNNGFWPNYQVYLYDGHTIQPISNSTFNNAAPQLNDAGQVTWQGVSNSGSSSGNSTIFLYQAGAAVSLLTKSAWIGTPDINNLGQIIYEDDSGPQNDIYLINPESYSGQVYAGADMPYYVGYTITWHNKLGPGYYVITGEAPSDDPGRNGQVWVSSYFDVESDHAYVPVGYAQGLAAGNSYLGSEGDTILDLTNPAVHFGYRNGDLWAQANALDRFSFVYIYDNGGDYYYGVVFATVTEIVSLASSVSTSQGAYQFVDMTYGFDPALDGAVQVAAYYDAASSHTYAVDNTTGPLGAETAWLDGNFDSFRFSPTSHVDLVNRYSFVYWYNGGGDYYYGQAYLTAAQVQAVATVTSAGTYQFVDMAYGFAPPANPANPVQVNDYYNANTQHTYTAYNTTGSLGAETSLFDGYTDSYSFSPGGAKNLVNRYSFIYWYSSGSDYYYGQAYLTHTQAQAATVPTSAGYYQFVDLTYGFTAPANPVRVTAYYDANTQHVYTAYGTTGPLGSETAWFYGDVDSFSFSPSSAEDLVNRYAFVYWYNSGSDYYYGQAYATTAQAQAAAVSTSAGHYQFVDMAYGFAPRANPVQVASYYDASVGHSYSAYGATGTLDSETAWFTGDSGNSVNFDPDHKAP
jgi:hypothetical protein